MQPNNEPIDFPSRYPPGGSSHAGTSSFIPILSNSPNGLLDCKQACVSIPGDSTLRVKNVTAVQLQIVALFHAMVLQDAITLAAMTGRMILTSGPTQSQRRKPLLASPFPLRPKQPPPTSASTSGGISKSTVHHSSTPTFDRSNMRQQDRRD